METCNDKQTAICAYRAFIDDAESHSIDSMC